MQHLVTLLQSMCLKADSHELRLTRAFVADSCIATAEIRNFQFWAGALVRWLWEETHILKVVGSNPSTVYWMDIFHKYLL